MNPIAQRRCFSLHSKKVKIIIQKAYNFKQLDELTSSSGTLKNVDLKSLLSEKYSVVINLLPDDSEYAIEGEKEDLESLGIHYIYIPIDWSEPKHTDSKPLNLR